MLSDIFCWADANSPFIRRFLLPQLQLALVAGSQLDEVRAAIGLSCVGWGPGGGARPALGASVQLVTSPLPSVAVFSMTCKLFLAHALFLFVIFHYGIGRWCGKSKGLGEMWIFHSRAAQLCFH